LLAIISGNIHGFIHLKNVSFGGCIGVNHVADLRGACANSSVSRVSL
jgi:hypothetical protein